VRSTALQRFGAQNLRAGQPFAELEEVLVPLYFLHRYQVEAVHRLIGGMYYEYSVYDGERAEPEQVTPIAAADQMRALEALMLTLRPDVLALSPSILATIPPKPVGYSRNRESFPLRTSLGLDYATIAETAADHTLSGILQGERLARLINQHSLDPNLPSIQDVLDRLMNSSWFAERSAGQSGRVQQAVNNVMLYRMLALLRAEHTDNQVKASVNLALADLEEWLDDEVAEVSNNDWRAHYRLALDELENWSVNGVSDSLLSEPMPMPPGAPI